LFSHWRTNGELTLGRFIKQEGGYQGSYCGKLPHVVQRLYRLRIANGRDTLRANEAHKNEWWHASCHIWVSQYYRLYFNLMVRQYHLIADVNAGDPDTPDVEADEPEAFYGRFEHTTILHSPQHPSLAPISKTRQLSCPCVSPAVIPHVGLTLKTKSQCSAYM